MTEQINPVISLLEETFGQGSVSRVVDQDRGTQYLRVIADQAPVYFTYGSSDGVPTTGWREGLDVLITGMVFPESAMEDWHAVQDGRSHVRSIVRVYDRLREIYPDSEFRFFIPEQGIAPLAEPIIENMRTDIQQ